MPKPVTQDQTVEAVNLTLVEMKPEGNPIASLDTDALSDPAWSCNNFSPTLLEKVCAVTGFPEGALNTTKYAQGAALPNSFADGSFVNISMTGDPSALNHNFNILVSGGTTYLMEAFLNYAVRIVQSFDNERFITLWQNLSNNVDWQGAYAELFGVAPSSVVQDPPEDTWLTSQYVTQ